MDFSKLLYNMNTNYNKILSVGDFNSHMDSLLNILVSSLWTYPQSCSYLVRAECGNFINEFKMY